MSKEILEEKIEVKTYQLDDNYHFNNSRLMNRMNEEVKSQFGVNFLLVAYFGDLDKQCLGILKGLRVDEGKLKGKKYWTLFKPLGTEFEEFKGKDGKLMKEEFVYLTDLIEDDVNAFFLGFEHIKLNALIVLGNSKGRTTLRSSLCVKFVEKKKKL